MSWAHVGQTINAAVVFGTPNKVYAMHSWACGGCKIDPALGVAPAPGKSGWVLQPAPPDMLIGSAQAVSLYDGMHYIVITANWKAGLWRIVE
jgi:hypothetical protein